MSQNIQLIIVMEIYCKYTLPFAASLFKITKFLGHKIIGRKIVIQTQNLKTRTNKRQIHEPKIHRRKSTGLSKWISMLTKYNQAMCEECVKIVHIFEKLQIYRTNGCDRKLELERPLQPLPPI